MMTVREVSRLTGVSVRTLHHYDAIGLLKPSRVGGNGYRYYDEAALARLRSILLFRELRFPLEKIRILLEREVPGAMLDLQIEMLESEQRRIGNILTLARTIRERGENAMDLKAFDTSELNERRREAEARWGETAAWREYAENDERQTKEDRALCADGLTALLGSFGALKDGAPEDKAAQSKVEALKSFITENFYTCTEEILSGLGRMYVADERFKHNIDAAGGDGTAEFISRAIAVRCSKDKA